MQAGAGAAFPDCEDGGGGEGGGGGGGGRGGRGGGGGGRGRGRRVDGAGVPADEAVEERVGGVGLGVEFH